MQLNNSPLVSVIMNCYNGEKYLKEAVDSVLAQTYGNWELIFWDNQSTDRSAEIFNSYTDKRLKYFYAENHTVLYEARGYAVEKSCGKYIAFLDCDDLWFPEKIKVQIPLFENNNVGLVYSNFIYINEINDTKYIGRENTLPVGSVLTDLLKKYEIGLLTIMIRRSAYEQLTPQFDQKYNIIGDFDFALRLSISWQFKCIQEPIAYCRLHGDNLQFRGEKQTLNELQEWINTASNNHDIYKHIEFYIFKSNIIRTISIYEAKHGNHSYALKNIIRSPLAMNKTIIFNKFVMLFAIITPSFLIKLLVGLVGHKIKYE